jgi:hypothetical protein
MPVPDVDLTVIHSDLEGTLKQDFFKFMFDDFPEFSFLYDDILSCGL